MADLIDRNHGTIKLSDPNFEALTELVRAARWYAKEKVGQDIAPGFGDGITHIPRMYQ